MKSILLLHKLLSELCESWRNKCPLATFTTDGCKSCLINYRFFNALQISQYQEHTFGSTGFQSSYMVLHRLKKVLDVLLRVLQKSILISGAFEGETQRWFSKELENKLFAAHLQYLEYYFNFSYDMYFSNIVQLQSTVQTVMRGDIY